MAVKNGTAAANTIFGTNGNDSINGAGGDDTLYGGVSAASTTDIGADILLGGTGNDFLFGQGGNDVLDGGSGNDRLNGGTGADKMTGGGGNDTYFVDHVKDTVTEAAGAGSGTDTVRSSLFVNVMAANVENLVLTGVNDFDDLDAHGNSLDNIIDGNGGDNAINLWSGNDTASGGAGNDNILGRSGNDFLEGGGNNDHLLGGGGEDVLDGGADQDVLSGGTENDTLFGGDGRDLLNGGSEDDLLDGGAGLDILIGRTGSDWLIYDADDEYVSGGSDYDSSEDLDIDTLALAGDGQMLDFSAIRTGSIFGFEVIDLTGDVRDEEEGLGLAGNGLSLSVEDLLDLSDTSDTLTVDAEEGDVVVVTDGEWSVLADEDNGYWILENIETDVESGTGLGGTLRVSMALALDDLEINLAPIS